MNNEILSIIPFRIRSNPSANPQVISIWIDSREKRRKEDRNTKNRT